MARVFFYLFILGFLNTILASHDTTYYKKYDNRLIISIYQSKRSYTIPIEQFLVKDTIGKTKMELTANAYDVSGIEIDYDKFSLAFDYKAVPSYDEKKLGKTTYSNLSFSFGGNRWIAEARYRKYKGFYDLNSKNYMPSTDSTGVDYYVNSSLSQEVYKAKFLYFNNSKKYSHKSSYTYNYRQIKSAASSFFIASTYLNRLRANRPFVADSLSRYYGRFSSLSQMDISAISFGIGVAGNLVIKKRVFFNATLGVSLEAQWRTYGFGNTRIEKAVYIQRAGDVRLALGYNGDKFFFTLTGIYDNHFYKSKQIGISSQFYSGTVSIGYRFGIREREIIRKMRANKYYQLL